MQIYEAIAWVISSMPPPDAAAALGQFALEIVARINFKAGLDTPTKDQLQQTTGTYLLPARRK